MDLRVQPDSLIVLGGGSVGTELGQFFARIGTHVTLVQRGDSLIGRYAHRQLGDLEVVGSVKGREFSFAYSAAMNGQQLTFTVKGTVQSADSLTGTASLGPMGAASFVAKRQRERSG